MTFELWATIPTMPVPVRLATYKDRDFADRAMADGQRLYPTREYEIREGAAAPDIEDRRLVVLRSLNVAQARAFFDATDPKTPHLRVHNPDKVLVRIHKERIAHSGLTDEERKASEDWIAARIAKGR